MSKREKIIVGLMILAVMYGAYAVFIEPAMKKKAREAAPQEDMALDDFVSQISLTMAVPAGTEKAAFAIRSAEDPWDKDPFAEAPLALTQERREQGEEADVPVAEMVYSGYLRMGERDLAIINGHEYGLGERIEPQGWLVQRITPTAVTLASKKPGRKIVVAIETLE